MAFSTLHPQGHAPVQRMHEDLAAVLLARTEPPESWVQLHFGFLCHQAPGKAGWQIGRQPGSWVWLQLSQAQRFMGGLDDGQGQPVIVSTWCPTWPELDDDMQGYFLGAPRMDVLANTCWWVDTYALHKKPALYKPAPGSTEVWRLRLGRRYADISPEAWTCIGSLERAPPLAERVRPSPQVSVTKLGIRD